MKILKIEGLCKSFDKTCVINNLNLEIEQGSIYGFLGSNGAGKTTTMKMILGLLKPDSGKIYINDELVTYGETKTNKYVGYLSDVPEFYGYMTPREYLALCADITKINNPKDKIDELLNLVGLSNVDKHIKGFSRGMKQRLGIAQALINEPLLLIADEPTSALDPLGRKELLDILNKVKGKTTVLFSTHILTDVERIADEVAIISNGKIKLEGSIAQLKTINSTRDLVLELANIKDIDKIKELIPFKSIKEDTITIEVSDEELSFNILKILFDNKIAYKKIEYLEKSLETIFMEAVL